MTLPPMHRIEQRFDDTCIKDVSQEVRRLFVAFKPSKEIKPGQSVAVAVGSRGIHGMFEMVRTSVESLKELGLKPHIIPAMGSHGGATGPGQAQVLAGLGISEETVGVPVVASMDTVILGELESGAPVFFSKDAMQADHLMLINRVKPHTNFRSEVESGLCKMLAVGLGRQKGASTMHRYGLAESILPAARMILEKAPLLCGLGVVDNSLNKTKIMELTGPGGFVSTDAKLLKEAWLTFPRIPVDDLDILVVDQIGKNISGAGIDPNVIGFWRRQGGPRKPDYRILIVMDITDESHGNAMGIGMADLTTNRLMEKLDMEAFRMNALTSGVLGSGRLPIALENGRAALDTALGLVPDPAKVRMGRIRNTKDLGVFWASPAVLPELEAKAEVEVDPTPQEIQFDSEGAMKPAR